jgi:predicted DsbA family dithiol-disulfide isomerase
MDPPNLIIDVFSDVVCPWCYLGKRRLTRALALLPKRSVAVRWRPFRLDPTIPPEGIPRDEYIMGKFGSMDAIEPAHRQLVEAGRNEGIAYRFDLIARAPSTVDAHRLIRWAAGPDRQDAIVERLFAAYFIEGRDIGDRSILVALGTEVGLGEDIDRRLASGEDRDVVENEVAAAYQMGINGVPCFVLNRRLAVMGAQSPEALVEAIGEADAVVAPGGAAVA